MEKHRFFTYGWHIDEDEEDITSIRIYGINNENENVCVRVNNFTPYVYLELPERIQWTEARAQMVGNKLDELTGQKKPLAKCLVYKKKLYGAHMDKNNKPNKVFPFMFCKFSNHGDIKNLGYKLRRKINVTGLGQMTLKIHEQNADPILQLTCCRELPTAGWVNFHGKRITGDKKVTLCDHEFVVRWKHLFKCEEEGGSLAKPLIMGYDIEVNSSNPAIFPDSDKPGDKVFQISCVFYREGDPIDEYTPYLLSLGDPDQKTTGEDVIIKRYETESDLLEGFCDLIRDEGANLIAGYNILGFDIPYMIGRAKHNLCIHKFDQQGFHKFGHASEKTIKWSSSAYKNQEFQFLDAEGRVYIDLLPLVKRDYKLSNYKLKTISTYFLGQTKDPLSVKGIFKCYRIGMKGGKKGSRALGVVGKYCVQDSVLVIRLMKHLQTWVGLCEMAKTCSVPIFVLYTQGQQIKVFSQVYKFCMYDNKVVESDGYVVKEDERYVGAHVFDPVPGCYDVVLPFDFASLYPTTIIAYNIDYSTWVNDDSIPDSDCNVMIWEDHVGCCHDPKVVRKVALTKIIDSATAKVKLVRIKKNNTLDKYIKKELIEEIKTMVEDIKPYRKERSILNKSKPKYIMCAKRNYRFLKEPKGVIPTISQNLLDARANTRKEIKDNKAHIKILKESGDDCISEIQHLIELNKVLNKRQLAYKISANSMYGAMGVRRGYLPFMPGAMCTTYMGRVNIEKVSEVIPKKYGGELIYGDTDSNYIHFPHLKTAQEAWDHAEYVAAEVTKMFPNPIKLEFEEVIYWRFFILTKKRYMYLECLRDGNIGTEVGKKGVLLARRDTCSFIRNIYESVISKVFNRENRDDIMYFVIQEINRMCSHSLPTADFIVTKGIGSVGDLKAIPFVNEQGKKKAMVGDYNVPILSSDPEERKHQYELKGVGCPKDYYLKCLPAQVQLGERMKSRGQRADAGSRIEYVVSTLGGHIAKQYVKVESAEYFSAHGDVLGLDYMYYLKLLSNPMDQAISVAYFNKTVDTKFLENFVLDQYKFRLKVRTKVLNELKSLFSPVLTFTG
jgi:DNA polymerase elongation subunit (family B)